MTFGSSLTSFAQVEQIDVVNISFESDRFVCKAGVEFFEV